MADPLLDIHHIDGPIDEYLASIGRVFTTFEARASGQSFGAEVNAWRYFVKHAETDAVLGLDRHLAVGRSVQHSAIPRHLNSIVTPSGRADVYEWVDGHNVYDTKTRFYSLSVPERIRVLTTLYDVHQMVSDAGYISVDLYDGSLIYDFDRRATHVIDMAEYRPAPFRVTGDRLPGSTRFMAPEEFESGALIDETTNVYVLGRAAFVLLGDGTGDADSWGWSDTTRAIAERATNPDRELRYESVTEYLDAWVQTVRMADALGVDR